MGLKSDSTDQVVTSAMLEKRLNDFQETLESGAVQIPVPSPVVDVFAGGTNHWPDSDVNYSTDAVTVEGTTPASAGDGNQQAWRIYRQKKADDLTIDTAHSLKAVGESTYAGNEGADPWIPDWDRVNGWARMGGAVGTDQYDLAIAPLNSRLVGPGDTWYASFRCVALDATAVPSAVQVELEVWEKRSGDEGIVTGGNFALTVENKTPGTTDTKYKVLAATDGGVSVLSSELDVATAPDVLSSATYLKIAFSILRKEGFISFEIHRFRNGVYRKLFTVRNTIDFQYIDTGEEVGEVESGWPADPGNAPQAIARTHNLLIGSFGSGWQFNQLTIKIPNTYNFSLAVSQYLRFKLTAETGVNRHLGFDRFVFSTTSHQWAPDQLPAFADGTYPLPSVSPTSGQQGSGGGIGPPPDPGGGGCVVTSTPVLIKTPSQLLFRPYNLTIIGREVFGDRPYVIRKYDVGMVAEYYIVKSANGVTEQCSARNRFLLDPKRRTFIEARMIKPGITRLPVWVRSRGQVMSKIVSVKHVLKPVEVGTYVLTDPTGDIRTGEGIYIAGESKNSDRGFYNSNRKNTPEDLPF